jgi:hypothetical protein
VLMVRPMQPSVSNVHCYNHFRPAPLNPSHL